MCGTQEVNASLKFTISLSVEELRVAVKPDI